MAFIVVWVVCLIFWAVISMLSGGEEPWDAASFWTIIYPLALALSALLGSMLKIHCWSAGAIVMFAQVLVTMAVSSTFQLLGAGVIYAAILSVPAISLSWIAGRIRRHYSNK